MRRGAAVNADRSHICRANRPERDERDVDASTPRSAAAQRRVAAFLLGRGRVTQFLKAHDIRLTDDQMAAFMEALEVEFFAAIGLLARRAGRDFRPDRRPERVPSWSPTTGTKPAGKEDAQGAATLTGILAVWWREAQATGRKPNTYESYSNTTAALVAFLSHDDARRVTPGRHRAGSVARVGELAQLRKQDVTASATTGPSA